MKRLLVVVDMQNDFVTGALGTGEARAILPQVKEKIVRVLEAGDTPVFTQDTHGPDYLDTQEGKNLPVPHCLRGSEGWELVPELRQLSQGCRIFEKPAFGSLELAAFAAGEGFDQVGLVGVCTDVCVISNALLLKAALPQALVRVDPACCAGVTPDSHRTALAAMAACQVAIEEN